MTDIGLKLLELERKSRRHTYIDDNGNMCIYRDPMFDEEKLSLMNRIGRENKRKIAERLNIKVCELKRERF